jgi:hypothetical protein
VYPGHVNGWTRGTGIRRGKHPTRLVGPIFWLTRDADSGKSVLSSYVINGLEENKVQCNYFFFKQGIPPKSSIMGCLLSLAFQVGQNDEQILGRPTQLSQGSETWTQLDERTLWRKVFLCSILRESNAESRCWVIDALDECRRYLFSLLAKAPP